MSARDTQVGGRHYKAMKVEPWDVIDANGLGFYDGNVLKYVMRFRAKGGVEDLRKAQHYLAKLIEVEEQAARAAAAAGPTLRDVGRRLAAAYEAGELDSATLGELCREAVRLTRETRAG